MILNTQRNYLGCNEDRNIKYGRLQIGTNTNITLLVKIMPILLVFLYRFNIKPCIYYRFVATKSKLKEQ